MTFLVCAVVVVASFYVLLTQGLAVLEARRTGVLIGKRPDKVRIERAVDPEYFDELLDARTKALHLPLFIAGAAGVMLVWAIFAMMFVLGGGLRPA